MAEGIFNSLSGGRHHAVSAGTQPSAQVGPVVVQLMREIGIDISSNKPKKLTNDMAMQADLAVTMGCGPDVCPVAGSEMREWKIADPHGMPIGKVRLIRDDIMVRVKALLNELESSSIKLI